MTEQVAAVDPRIVRQFGLLSSSTLQSNSVPLTSSGQLTLIVRAMEEHIKAVLCRIILSALVSASLPFAHAQWGESPEAAGIEGPTAFALLLGLAMWSLLAAILYFFVGCVVQTVFRNRLQIAFYYDLLVGFVLVAILGFAGVMAHYSSTQP
jgi:hypothetical protein